MADIDVKPEPVGNPLDEILANQEIIIGLLSEICACTSRPHGMVVTATARTIQLDLAAAAVDDAYVGRTICIMSGTGDGQSRVIRAYDSNRRAMVVPNWVVVPNATSAYKIDSLGACRRSCMLADTNDVSELPPPQEQPI
jgi:hypothetical protein